MQTIKEPWHEMRAKARLEEATEQFEKTMLAPSLRDVFAKQLLPLSCGYLVN
jgi:hypothetical protein